MTGTHRFSLLLWPCAVLLVGLSACADQPPVAPTSNRALSFDVQGGCVATDPEVFGNLYLNGAASQRTDLTIAIDAADPETRSRLKDQFPQSMWVSPNIAGFPFYPLSRSFGWYDPRAGCECGGLNGYLGGDTASRAREVHWQSATLPYDPTSPERHCLVPGRYHVRLSGPDVDQEFDVEYVGVRAVVPGQAAAREVPNADLGGSLLVEPHTYTPYDTYSDHILNFDLAPPR